MVFVILCRYLDNFLLLFTKGFTEFDSPIVKANVGGTCLQSKLNKEKKITKPKKINILRRKGRRTVFIDDAKFNYTYNLG